MSDFVVWDFLFLILIGPFARYRALFRQSFVAAATSLLFRASMKLKNPFVLACGIGLFLANEMF
jgi:hypothetical protein